MRMLEVINKKRRKSPLDGAVPFPMILGLQETSSGSGVEMWKSGVRESLVSLTNDIRTP